MSENKKRLIAVPTSYNIYRVTDDVIQMNQAQMMTFPPVVVLETLVMQGLAKRVAVIQQFDMEVDEDEEQHNNYDPDEDLEKPSEGEEEPPVGQGPWYVPEEDG